MNATLTKLDNTELERLARLLEAKVAALRSATTALGIRLHERYTNQLDAVRAEVERRSCD